MLFPNLLIERSDPRTALAGLLPPTLSILRQMPPEQRGTDSYPDMDRSPVKDDLAPQRVLGPINSPLLQSWLLFSSPSPESIPFSDATGPAYQVQYLQFPVIVGIYPRLVLHGFRSTIAVNDPNALTPPQSRVPNRALPRLH